MTTRPRARHRVLSPVYSAWLWCVAEAECGRGRITIAREDGAKNRASRDGFGRARRRRRKRDQAKGRTDITGRYRQDRRWPSLRESQSRPGKTRLNARLSAPWKSQRRSCACYCKQTLLVPDRQTFLRLTTDYNVMKNESGQLARFRVFKAVVFVSCRPQARTVLVTCCGPCTHSPSLNSGHQMETIKILDLVLFQKPCWCRKWFNYCIDHSRHKTSSSFHHQSDLRLPHGRYHLTRCSITVFKSRLACSQPLNFLHNVFRECLLEPVLCRHAIPRRRHVHPRRYATRCP